MRRTIDSKTKQEDLDECVSWIEKVTGISANGKDFADYLHDGVILCQFITYYYNNNEKFQYFFVFVFVQSY
jgi:hypothetical protein